jgi:NAD-dependent SIR2 family protein deacetylase
MEDFGEKLMKMKASCRKCEREMTFEDGLNCARDNGINSEVVMCKKCCSVYKTEITFSGMTLLDDVTNLYSVQVANCQQASKKWWQFWK